MNVLVLNCGSSSVKFQLIAADLEHIAQNTDVRLAHGIIERLGGADAPTRSVESLSALPSLLPLAGVPAMIDKSPGQCHAIPVGFQQLLNAVAGLVDIFYYQDNRVGIALIIH